jgi:hypothetical protein
MVKFTGRLSQFEELHESVQMELDLLPKETDLEQAESELGKKVAEVFGEFSGAEQLLHLWESANKMRLWFAEKKQIVMERDGLKD